MENLQEYKDIINKLSRLNQIVPRKQLKSHFESTLISALPDRQDCKLPLFGYSLRFMVLAFILILLGSSGIALAAEHATPGSLFYPLKQAVQDAKLAVLNNPAARTLFHLENTEDTATKTKQSVTNHDNDMPQNESDKSALETPKPAEQKVLGSQAEKANELRNSVPANALEKATRVSTNGQDQAQEALQRNPSSAAGTAQNNSQIQEIGIPGSMPEQSQSTQNRNKNTQQNQENTNEHRSR